LRKLRRLFSLLIVVAFTAATLTLLLSAASAARPAAQVSPLLPTATLTSTVTPFSTAAVGLPTASPGTDAPPPGGPLPVETFPPLAPPTSVPLPTAAQPTPTVSGFLPAPTITNPDEIQSLPLAQPPVSGGGGRNEPFPTPTPRPPRNPALVAGVAVLNALWLICGSALLIGGIAYIILLARRKSDS
jgi:hypothetical protein